MPEQASLVFLDATAHTRRCLLHLDPIPRNPARLPTVKPAPSSLSTPSRSSPSAPSASTRRRSTPHTTKVTC